MLFLSMQIFSYVNLCDVILVYLEFLHSCKDYMLEKIFEINSNWIRVNTMLPLNIVHVIDSFYIPHMAWYEPPRDKLLINLIYLS